MDYADIDFLRAQHAAWRLLRADSAPLVLTFLGRVFVEENSRSLPASELESRLDDQLYAINAATSEVSYPRSPAAYLDTWSAPEQGWLRKFYAADSDEPHYDATPALEKAYAWVDGLRERSFVGTESRLHTLIELLRQMVHGADTDPEARLEELRRRQAEIDAQIAEIEAGTIPVLDDAGLRDRYQLFSSTARDLLADFREVEDNFRRLDRAARERIAGWTGSKGELLDDLLGDRTSIAGSDQGRSFQAFYDFLLSRTRQDELADLLRRLQDIDPIDTDRRMRHVHHDWLEAAERTQQTVRQLSEQLRRFLDDQVWLENRRVMELLRSIEAGALAVRGEARPSLTVELAASSPTVNLPMERPLYTVRTETAFEDSVVEAADEDVDTSALFEQVYVDPARLAGHARAAVRRQGQVLLTDLLEQHPPEQGLAEIVGYLALAEEDLAVVIDEAERVRIPYVDESGAARVVRMPRVTLARRTSLSREVGTR